MFALRCPRFQRLARGPQRADKSIATHPESCPKYQEQLGRVALMRDMINGCVEHPEHGTPLEPDDPKMRALEAYIYAQRKGTQLDYGKH